MRFELFCDDDSVRAGGLLAIFGHRLDRMAMSENG
jgi:hypothetical protein